MELVKEKGGEGGGGSFVPFILPEETFIDICAECTTKYIEYKQFQNIHNFIYQKISFYTLFACFFLTCLYFKQVI